MAIAFIIMQIGNTQLDDVCDRVLYPAIRDAGLEPRRVDRHTTGNLLKSEIVEFINEAEIVVADLTNQRPNVYLEVGYAMGIDKFRNLILTARKDHLPGDEDWSPDGPKIHFDLAGYDILFWDPEDLEGFREELATKTRRRRAVTQPAAERQVFTLDSDWINERREIGEEELSESGFSTFMEVASGAAPPKPDASPKRLLEIAEEAQIHTFGWPLGVVLHTDEGRPRPRTDGIVATIKGRLTGDSLDYWALRRNGDFFLIKSLFEAKRDPDAIFFNTRIVRATEALMYCLRLYGLLGLGATDRFELQLRHGGLRGKYLSASSASRSLSRTPYAEELEITTGFTGTLGEAEGEMVAVVKQLTAPLFELFEFQEFGDPIYEQIVNAYVEGRVA